ncbi:hypothetical protein GCM10010441_37680 [Kitasatospora paracochleata]|uniref:Secreted protein n=1 Tax=Kitasatospora paracochleata TaxID=58354 RepID=A0ABT1J7A7_9ACTN|nr:hypothetical protein [Kitasatospora paracochleata]MCP2313328.1 hypothetical protein [Kitasatospora paracochleata]
MNHRPPSRRLLGRNTQRLGVLTVACLAALGIAGPAGAVPASSHPGRDVPVVRDLARTHADRTRTDQFQSSFDVRQLGAVVGAAVDNRALAVSAGCRPERPCRSVALSFQIVTMAGDQTRLSAGNTGRALNEHCAGCQTLAVAYQFIVAAPRPFTLSAQAQAQLAAVHRQLDALKNSREPVSVVHQQVDALADQVKAVLDREAAAAAKGPALAPLGAVRPTVTTHHQSDQAEQPDSGGQPDRTG